MFRSYGLISIGINLGLDLNYQLVVVIKYGIAKEHFKLINSYLGSWFQMSTFETYRPSLFLRVQLCLLLDIRLLFKILKLAQGTLYFHWINGEELIWDNIIPV